MAAGSGRERRPVVRCEPFISSLRQDKLDPTAKAPRSGPTVKALFASVLLLAGGTAAVTGSVEGLGAQLATLGQAPPSQLAVEEIPSSLIGGYMSAAPSCADLPWQVLAAIGWAESRHGSGRVDPVTGDTQPPILGPPLNGSGIGGNVTPMPDPSTPDGWAQAVGPMQFLSTTFTRWATLAPGRPVGLTPDPQNFWDATFTAARYLCAGRSAVGDIRQAIYSYNHSGHYVDVVWDKAIAYGMPPDGGTGVGIPTGSVAAAPGGRTFTGDANAVIEWALTQLGVPYVWGGTTPGRALDCSGLVYLAYKRIGVNLPRTTVGLVKVGVAIDPTGPLQLGDLIFSRGGRPTRDLGHVGMYAGGGRWIVAPRSGETVSLRPVPRGVQLVRRVLTAPTLL